MSQATDRTPEPATPRASVAELLYELSRLIAGCEPAVVSISIETFTYLQPTGLTVYTGDDVDAAAHWARLLGLTSDAQQVPWMNNPAWQVTGELAGWPVRVWWYRPEPDERYALTTTGEAAVGGAA